MFRPEGDAVVADCQLTGSRQLPNQTEPQVTTHFTARVRITKNSIAASTAPKVGLPVGPIVDAADIYRLYFHGPAYQVLARAWRNGERVIGQLAQDLPNNHHPSQLPTLVAPRLIELCFQTAGLWEMGVQSRMGLPRSIGKVCLERAPNLAEGPLYAVVTPNLNRNSFDAVVVDTNGNRYLQLSGYRTVALPTVVDGTPLKAFRAAA
jgi:hypothetical protein